MRTSPVGDLGLAYPACRALLGPAAWKRLLSACGGVTAQSFPEEAARQCERLALAPWLADLAQAERARRAVAECSVAAPEDVERFELNPALEALKVSWDVAPLVRSEPGGNLAPPGPLDAWVMVWRGSDGGDVRVETASDEDLLALKIVSEDLSAEQVASEGRVGVEVVDAVLSAAARKGLLVAPRSRLRRAADYFVGELAESFATAHTFGLQWHITQACDLHCKHCYDRSKRSAVTLEQGLRVLDDLRAFCRGRRVGGHVCFTGGNPLLHPQFFELYAAAAERSFTTSVLGNPAQREQLERILSIRRPAFYQVSLEGLREHNDDMRGAGHFDQTIAFLGLLKELSVPSAVMLTLTRDNMDQVLPLAERLRGLAGHFTFNRLSPVGEGVHLTLPDEEEYSAFLKAYVDAGRQNPIMGFKDNLINVVLHKRGLEPFGGCTGFGCGAAFSFLAVLPDGEAHACRKFPSLIGNVYEQTIAEIYDSEAAERYRRGSAACAGCRLRPVCRGCMAVTRGSGLDIFADRDPHCTLEAPAPGASSCHPQPAAQRS
jgi:selenobiotic family peptide radical SAM maturase